MIEKCSFGAMTIEGRTYTSDLKIFPDGRVADNWWRASGHRLNLDDITDLVATGPDVLVVGTGIFGRMKAEKGFEEKLSQTGIRVQVAWTKKAADIFNELRQHSQKIAGCFHLTC